MQLNGKYTTNPCENEFQLPLLYAAFQLEQLEIDTQQEKLLFVELFTIDTKVRSPTAGRHRERNKRFLILISFAVGAESAEHLLFNKIVSIRVQSRGDFRLVDQQYHRHKHIDPIETVVVDLAEPTGVGEAPILIWPVERSGLGLADAPNCD